MTRHWLTLYITPEEYHGLLKRRPRGAGHIRSMVHRAIKHYLTASQHDPFSMAPPARQPIRFRLTRGEYFQIARRVAAAEYRVGVTDVVVQAIKRYLQEIPAESAPPSS